MSTDYWVTFYLCVDTAFILVHMDCARWPGIYFFGFWGHTYRGKLRLHKLFYFHASNSIKELWQNVADYSKRNEENHERYQSTQLGKSLAEKLLPFSSSVPSRGVAIHFHFCKKPWEPSVIAFALAKTWIRQYFLGDASGRNTWKEELFQHFYQVVQKARDRERPSDCVIVSINNEQRCIFISFYPVEWECVKMELLSSQPYNT